MRNDAGQSTARCDQIVTLLRAGAQNVTAAREAAVAAIVERRSQRGRGLNHAEAPVLTRYELALMTVTARRFCDQQEMSLQTATGRSLP